MVKPLSDEDIEQKLAKYGIHIKMILYSQLPEINKIDDILPCILLYQLNMHVGHWVVLFRNKEGINYFDPTGHVPDELLYTSFRNILGRHAVNSDFTYLAYLVFRSGEKVIYNEFPLQPPGTMTCGYWSTIRLLSQGITNDEFNNIFRNIPVDRRQEIIVKIYFSL